MGDRRRIQGSMPRSTTEMAKRRQEPPSLLPIPAWVGSPGHRPGSSLGPVGSAGHPRAPGRGALDADVVRGRVRCLPVGRTSPARSGSAKAVRRRGDCPGIRARTGRKQALLTVERGPHAVARTATGAGPTLTRPHPAVYYVHTIRSHPSIEECGHGLQSHR